MLRRYPVLLFFIAVLHRFPAGSPFRKPVKYLVKQPAASSRVQCSRCVQTDSKNNSPGNAKFAGGDGEGAEGIKYCLPGIAGRIAYSDSADESQHGVESFRKNEIQAQENERAHKIKNSSLPCPFYRILFKWKTYRHTGDTGPHGSGEP